MYFRRWIKISNIELIKKIIPTLTFEFPYSPEEYEKNLYLENYHCHKDFSNTSTPDCAESIETYAERIHEFGAKCLYSGEHGSQGNQFQVYKVAEKEHLKYIHSSEVYWVKDRKEKDRANCHMIIAAKNAEGRRDINFALSMANIDGYYYKPRIDLELLFNIPKDNVIITSACLAGWNYEDAEEVWLKVHKYFGDNFFLEVQYHNTDKQKELNKRILKIAKEHNIQIICGLDSHYVKEENSIKRDQILKYKNINYPDEKGWYLDYPDTQTVIKRFIEQGVLNKEEIFRAIMNTNVFVSECEVIVLDRKFKIPSVYKDKTYKEKCKIYKDILNRAYAKEKDKSKEKADGIRYEAKQVMEAGVVDYFLTSKSIIDDAVNNEGGILTTTSRGSAASFITNKLLGLTTVDRFNADIPIYPERFLTKERVLAGQMPDIDMNVDNQREIIGIVSGSDPEVNRRLYYVSELDIKKSIVNVKLFEIYSGKTRTVKMWTNQYNRNPFELGSILYIISLEKKNKKEPTGEVDPKTGKKIYREVPDKFEFWLGKFTVKNNVEEVVQDI